MSVGQTVQPVVTELVATLARRTVEARLHTADVADVALYGIVTSIVVKRFTEEITGDACQEGAHIILVFLPVKRKTVQVLLLQTSEVIIDIVCKGHFNTVQGVFYLSQPVIVIVTVSIRLSQPVITGCAVNMCHHRRIATESISRFSYIKPVKQIILHTLHHTSLCVIIIRSINPGETAGNSNGASGQHALAVFFVSFIYAVNKIVEAGST